MSLNTENVCLLYGAVSWILIHLNGLDVILWFCPLSTCFKAFLHFLPLRLKTKIKMGRDSECRNKPQRKAPKIFHCCLRCFGNKKFNHQGNLQIYKNIYLSNILKLNIFSFIWINLFSTQFCTGTSSEAIYFTVNITLIYLTFTCIKSSTICIMYKPFIIKIIRSGWSAHVCHEGGYCWYSTFQLGRFLGWYIQIYKSMQQP